MENNSKMVRLVLGGVILLVVVGGGVKLLMWYGFLPSGDFPLISKSSWQAVFLTNNQVYFGHLQNHGRGYAVLKEIYYLRVGEPLQQGSPPQPALNLVKLGSELHGPEDTMYIPKDRIMFWENMRKDSQVVQAITNFLAQSQ